MTVHSFHLAEVGVRRLARSLVRPPQPGSTPGLVHAECMVVMELGSPIVSPRRAQIGKMAMFASWDSEAAIDGFLDGNDHRGLADGWHVRLEFMRRWGSVAAFGDLPGSTGESDPTQPVVAVTLARLKLPEVPRFIRWGKPVERQVRDDPATRLALAAGRPPRTVSTFSIWESEQAMTDMVHGRSAHSEGDRHAVAMVERRRKDFHHEFTTLRFRSLGEYGTWQGRGDYVPDH